MKSCVICGNLYQPSRYTSDRQLYCSPNCADKGRHARDREKRNAKMRERHAENRERYNEINRLSRLRRAEYYREYDRARWTGERREKHKTEARKREQRRRLSHPWEKLLRAAEWRAKKKGVPFSLTAEWAQRNWTGKCALTDIEFVLGRQGSGPKCLSPSIDRIKAELGYVPENCRFVIWAINAFKHDGDDSLMFRIAEALVKVRYISMT